MSLSRPRRFEFRDDLRAFLVLGLVGCLVGERQLSSRSRVMILARSWSFSNSRDWYFSSAGGSGSSFTVG